MPEAWAFWHMTPAEVRGRIAAHAAIQGDAMERIDALAWMTGAYVMRAQHDPKRYPKKPMFFKRARQARSKKKMTEAAMKGVLTAFADAHNKDVIE